MATGLGAGLYDPERETGCTIVGSTGCHMRIARSADAVRLNPDATGYTLSFPVPGTDQPADRGREESSHGDRDQGQDVQR